MTAELPFDIEVDRAAIEKRRAQAREAAKHQARIELRHASARRRKGRVGGAAPACARITFNLTPGELLRLERAAKACRMAPRAFVRVAALLYAKKLEEEGSVDV